MFSTETPNTLSNNHYWAKLFQWIFKHTCWNFDRFVWNGFFSLFHLKCVPFHKNVFCISFYLYKFLFFRCLFVTRFCSFLFFFYCLIFLFLFNFSSIWIVWWRWFKCIRVGTSLFLFYRRYEASIDVFIRWVVQNEPIRCHCHSNY